MSNPKLFEPFQLRAVQFLNRIVLSPMCQYAAVDGLVQPWHMAHHARFALSGVGSAIVEATGITPEGRITPGCLGLWDDRQIEGLTRIVDLYHSQQIPVGIQIGHAGRKASSALPWEGAGPLTASTAHPAWPTVAPSALAHMDRWPTPAPLDATGIARIVESFGSAARRAVKAGFDFVEIHGAHGYLIHSFFSPLSNKRTDAYGGSLENRMRFALDATKAMRANVPADMPVVYRISAIDNDPAGITIEDSVALCRSLASWAST